VTSENKAGSNGAASGCGTEPEDLIDADRVFQTDDWRVAFLIKPINRVGVGARSVTLKRTKMKMGKGNIFVTDVAVGRAEG